MSQPPELTNFSTPFEPPSSNTPGLTWKWLSNPPIITELFLQPAMPKQVWVNQTVLGTHLGMEAIEVGNALVSCGIKAHSGGGPSRFAFLEGLAYVGRLPAKDPDKSHEFWRWRLKECVAAIIAYRDHNKRQWIREHQNEKTTDQRLGERLSAIAEAGDALRLWLKAAGLREPDLSQDVEWFRKTIAKVMADK